MVSAISACSDVSLPTRGGLDEGSDGPRDPGRAGAFPHHNGRMPIPPKDELARLLDGDAQAIRGHGALDVPLDALRVTVRGIGELRLPVRPTQAKALVALAEPAPYGLGTETLVDTAVRDTGQIPSELVTVEWNGQLDALLEGARATLGLSPRARLTADFHSMLVYGKGQFFARHQDSEKHDGMVATLVVQLPAAHSGGELVVHDGRWRTPYAGSRHDPTAVVLYADRVHEVLPVKTGHRVTLTYTLIRGDEGDDVRDTDPRAGDAATLLTRHFTTPGARGWRAERTGPPTRLVYLLDHQYTPRSLAWTGLKGVDIARTEALRAGADLAGCEMLLALTDIHETWNTDDGPYARRRTRAAPDPDPDDLIESEVTLTHWRGAWSRRTEEVSAYVDGSEVCATTPTVRMTPTESEYEGYMGNYGNTIDRWYHRAAVIVWPARLRFVNRARIDMAWALDDLHARLDDGQAEAARADLEALLPFWRPGASGPRAGGLVETALLVAARLDDPTLAAAFLDSLSIVSLTAAEAPALLGLAETYGDDWARARVVAWFGSSQTPAGALDGWLTTLPQVGMALRDNPILTRMLVTSAWSLVRGRITPLLDADPTTWVRGQIATVAGLVTRVLQTAAACRVDEVRDEAVAACRSGERGLQLLTAVLGSAATWPDEVGEAARAGELAAYARGLLEERLDRPARTLDDWSLPPLTGCACEHCARLNAFLTGPTTRTLEIATAEQNRTHLEGRIRHAELPVSHTTRRQGRPYTLVLTKTMAVFEREIDQRREDQLTLDRLAAQWSSP